MTSLDAAITAFGQGDPVLVFDSAMREGETDLLYPGGAITPSRIRRLRRTCGGLLFLAIGEEIGEMFDMPFLQELHTESAATALWPLLSHLVTDDLPYDEKSAFTLSLNHRDTYTGITDRDRALTTKRFAELSAEGIEFSWDFEIASSRLGDEFRTPGHIPVCREASGGIVNRQGHTELAVAIARLANLPPVVIGAEMLDPEGDGALDFERAKRWGLENNIPFVLGSDLLKGFTSASQEVAS